MPERHPRHPRHPRHRPVLRVLVLRGITLLGVLVGIAGFVPDSVSAQLTGNVGGGPLGLDGPCLSPADAQMIHGVIATHAAQLGPIPFGPSPPYEFYPMGGRLWRDLSIINYNDLDPSPGVLSWDCTNHSYDGHDASDVALRSFGEQAIGVPIFAVQDGVVLTAQDGNPDMNTCGFNCTTNGNGVVIDHGGGRVCLYWHMRNGSVAPSVGDAVVAGEQIGLTASSGFSTGPHLHFATYEFGLQVEPWEGPCDLAPSHWVDQVPTSSDFYAFECGVTTQPLGGAVVLPFELPRQGYYLFNTQPLVLWVEVWNLPANASWVVQYIRPTGQVASTMNGNIGNPAYRWSWWYFTGFSPLMNSIPGTWTVRLTMAGQVLVEAPFTVLAAAVPGFNGPPVPVSVSFEPANPEPGDVVFCEIDTDLLYDDPDYDIVRYQYLWDVDGVVVRDVISAGHADAIPSATAPLGSLLTCTVTPSDGILSAPSSSVTVLIGGGLFERGDCNTDDSFNIGDPIFHLGALFAGGPTPTCDDACDANDGGQNDISDPVYALATLFSGGPPPSAPYGSCGVDPTADLLDCASFPGCP